MPRQAGLASLKHGARLSKGPLKCLSVLAETGARCESEALWLRGRLLRRRGRKAPSWRPWVAHFLSPCCIWDLTVAQLTFGVIPM